MATNPETPVSKMTEIKTYKCNNGTFGFIAKRDGKVVGGDIGYPSEAAAYRDGSNRYPL